ncbi:helix-turn-helix domain-containing protein [Pontibacter sp. HSC-36F09]|uniref:helix-turn-helix domain-containing protein n=1 Tax=Pontibacter sp. HSC-36F09 TaxID=2910966 RepID=UPI00209D6029|nr:helix-turn-helix domain-containing protein [Pontibacter sp. HSC-36F09]MCP2042453.1 transcriptional regulator with XRE-family HTH domain [Pontibacter sp. HSC-36F09]
MNELGNRILEIRKRKGLSQEELSEMAGISLRTLQRIEKGETEPRGYTLKSICQALNVDVEEVYDYGKEPDKSVLLLMHLSVLSYLLMPLGNLVFPLIIWITQKKKVLHVYEQGISLLNFQITWSLVTYPLVMLFAWMKIMHYPGSWYVFAAYLVLYFLNALYVIRVCWRVSKDATHDPYPVSFTILKA